MTSCAVHPNNNSNSNSSQNKNGHGDEGQTADGQSSLSSSSSSSTSVSRNSTTTNTTTNTTPSSAESAEKRAKTLKSLIKKRIDPSQDFIKSHNKRVKFSETMQVFLYEMPDNQMPQIIALKSPAELNLMEFQQYMFEPPAEYQDFLAFEPPPDYRDFIANSLGVFRNEVTFDYIDDDDDDSDSASGTNGTSNPSPRSSKNSHDKKSHINSLLANAGDHTGQQNSKWQSMILENNLDSLEEEQIIGVLKEDDILQAIGSQISLPTSESGNHNGGHSQQMNGDLEQQNYHDRTKGQYTFELLDQQHQHHLSYDEQLSSEDFPVHHQLNSYLLNAGHLEEEDDDEACCIDGSSPNGSLQDLASDSSITSQDTIILINQQQQQQHNNNNNSSKSFSVEDNIYENVQNRINEELGGLLSGDSGNGLHFEEDGKRSSMTDQEMRDAVNANTLPPDKTTDGELMMGKGGGSAAGDAVLYENTSELMATVNATGGSSSLAGNGGHMSGNVNHSSSSSAEASSSASEGNGSEQQSGKNNQQQQQHSMVSKFRQNLMFYESMMQQNSSAAAAVAAASSAAAAAASSSSSSSSSIPPSNVNSKHVPNENGRSGSGGSATATGQTTLQQQQRATMAIGDGASHLIPVRFPLYTIVDANRTSSSSSLSSTSSSTSSMVCTNANSHNNIPQTLSVVTNIGQLQQQQPHQLSTSPTQQLHQVSPNSSTSSSSSSGNMPHEYLLQYGGQRPAMLVSGKMLAEAGCTPAQLSININASNNSSVISSNAPSNNNKNSNNNFTVPSSSLSNESAAGMSNGPYVSHVNMSIPPGPPTQQQLSPRPPGPQICLVNNNGSLVGTNGQPLHHHLTTSGTTAQIRPGQVVYRYPYAFIQHSAANGVQTIRPVQYILQTNPQTGAQSVIYNPRQIVINSNSVNVNSQQAPTSSGANGNTNMSAAGSSTSPSNNNPPKAGSGQPVPQMMTLSGAHSVPIQGDQHSAVSIPVRRILVPQGTVLAPRIMHFHTASPHPHHLQQLQQQQQNQQQNKPPPPYQYYVQQRHQQAAAVFAYQQHPNGPLRAPTPTPGQIHTVDVNSNQHQQLHGGHTDFPNPSEIRRRDGLYAYPQVLLKADEAGKGAAGGAGTSQLGGSDLNSEERDELEEFVQQEQQRTDRIKKRYSFTEDDDPTFGFARRPSVRGIRPKFGTTSEIIQQMTGSGTLPRNMSSQQTGSGGSMQQKLIAMSVGQQQQHQQQLHQQQQGQPGGNDGGSHTIFAYGTIPKNAQFINLNHTVSGQSVAMGPHGPQMISIVKQMGEVQLSDNLSGQQQQMHQLGKSQTLPRQLQATPSMNKIPNGEALICMDANGGPQGMANHTSATLSRDQLKLQLQKQLERQMQQQQQQKQTVIVSRVALPPSAQVLGPRPLSGDEGVRGVPEGSSFSPNHPSSSGEGSAGSGGVPFVSKPDLKGVNLVDGKQGNVDMASYYSLNV